MTDQVVIGMSFHFLLPSWFQAFCCFAFLQEYKLLPFHSLLICSSLAPSLSISSPSLRLSQSLSLPLSSFLHFLRFFVSSFPFLSLYLFRVLCPLSHLLIGSLLFPPYLYLPPSIILSLPSSLHLCFLNYPAVFILFFLLILSLSLYVQGPHFFISLLNSLLHPQLISLSLNLFI